MSIRVYEIDSKHYPSVTSILSFVFGIGEYLNRWSVKVAVEAILDAKDTVPESELAEIGERARLQVLRKAQIKGTIVHSYVQGKTEGFDPDIDPAYAPYYKAFLKFLDDHRLAPIFQERKVWNDAWQYAGRLDFYGWLDGRPVLIDFKTSKHLRAEYGLQLAAYKECLAKMGYPVEATYILHLRESGRYTLKEYNEPFVAFTNLLPVFHWKITKERPQQIVATDEDAVAEEMKTPAVADEGIDTDLTTEPNPEFVPPLNVPGHSNRPAAQGISPSNVEPEAEHPFDPACLCQVCIEHAQTVGLRYRTGKKKGQIRRVKLHSSQESETSSHRTAIQPQNQEEDELDPEKLEPLISDKLPTALAA